MRRWHALAVWAALTGVALSERPALAQTPHRDDLWAQVHADMFTQWQRALPSVRLTPDNAREAEGMLSSSGPSWMLGAGSGVDLVWRDRLILPMLRVEAMWSVGRRPVVYGAVDGTIAEMHPWKSGQVNMLFSGVGGRWKRRRWAVSAVVQPGFSVTFLDTDVANGATGEQRVLVGIHGMIRGQIEGCRRLDPEQRVCLLVAPSLLNESLFNGGAVGLRWEYGP